MASNLELKAVITAEDKASQVLSGFGKSLERAETGSFALLGGLTALAGAAVLTVKAFTDSENTAAQLDAVLKSTAGAAGVTKEAALDLAAGLQATTTFSDEAVLSAENLLLTFTSIGKDIFPDATKTVLDMSQALGQDTKASAIQLGKALQDPITGVTALKRVGVSFNETQMETIKNLVETGRQAEAQKLILAELNKEFGGSATAAAQTFSGQLKQIWNSIDDVMEIIGKLIADQIRPLTQAFLDWYNAMGGSQGIMDKFTATLKEWNDKGYIKIAAGAILGGLVPALWAMASAIGANVIALAPFMIAGAALVFLFEKAPAVFWAVVGAISGLAIALFTQAIPALIATIPPLLTVAAGVIAATWPFILIGAAVAAAAYLIITHWGQVKAFVVAAADVIGGAINRTKDYFRSLPGVVQVAMSQVGQFILAAMGPLGNFIRLAMQAYDAIVSLTRAIGGKDLNAKLHSLKIPGFATGVENFSGGLAVVGERGPEVVSLPRGSSVIPNNQIGGMGSSTNINITFTGPMMGTASEAREYAKMIANALKDVAGQRNQTVAEYLT